MRKICLLIMISTLLAMPTATSAGELKLTIQNGLVTLIAQDVPLSTIMAEWARVGQTKIVNGDKIMTLVSLHIVDTPERKALDILLRAASGYMVAERPTRIASASVFDRIMILPTSQAPANTGPVAAPPAMFVPRPVTPPVPDVDDEPVAPPGSQALPGPAQPMIPGQNPAVPNAPLTAPRPGPLPQPAAQQPVPFGAPKPPPTGPGGRGGGPGGGGQGGGGQQ